MRGAAVLAVLAALVVAACEPDYGRGPGDDYDIRVPLTATGSDERVGFVELVRLGDSGGRTEIVISYEGADDVEPETAHLHEAPCEATGGDPRVLAPFVDGTSRTEVELGLDDLITGSWSVDVHPVTAGPHAPVACVDLVDQDVGD